MRLVHPSGEFWNGIVAGKSVRASWTKKGKESRSTTPFKTTAAAKTGFAGLVKKLSAMGYRPEIPAGVLEALGANPRDESSLTVLADALQSTSDPRGELAALVLARKEEAVARFLETRGEQLFGAALQDVESDHLVDLSWTPGFLFAVTVDSEAGEPTSQVELVRRLVRAPVASLLREVTLFPGDEPW
ncbi:MAG: hypothetical protein JNM17_23490, partial [Archangium sp.]|nr:hypothetical protein [Archangium sp.]